MLWATGACFAKILWPTLMKVPTCFYIHNSTDIHKSPDSNFKIYEKVKKNIFSIISLIASPNRCATNSMLIFLLQDTHTRYSFLEVKTLDLSIFMRMCLSNHFLLTPPPQIWIRNYPNSVISRIFCPEMMEAAHASPQLCFISCPLNQ